MTSPVTFARFVTDTSSHTDTYCCVSKICLRIYRLQNLLLIDKYKYLACVGACLVPKFEAEFGSVEDLSQADRVTTRFRPEERAGEVEVEVDVWCEAARDGARHTFVL